MTEALVSILIVGLISAGLAAMIAAASRINQTLKGEDQALYASVTAVEQAVGTTDGTVKVTFSTAEGLAGSSVSVPVLFYSDAALSAEGETRLVGYTPAPPAGGGGTTPPETGGEATP